MPRCAFLAPALALCLLVALLLAPARAIVDEDSPPQQKKLRSLSGFSASIPSHIQRHILVGLSDRDLARFARTSKQGNADVKDIIAFRRTARSYTDLFGTAYFSSRFGSDSPGAATGALLRADIKRAHTMGDALAAAQERVRIDPSTVLALHFDVFKALIGTGADGRITIALGNPVTNARARKMYQSMRALMFQTIKTQAMIPFDDVQQRVIDPIAQVIAGIDEPLTDALAAGDLTRAQRARLFQLYYNAWHGTPERNLAFIAAARYIVGSGVKEGETRDQLRDALKAAMAADGAGSGKWGGGSGEPTDHSGIIDAVFRVL